MEIRLYDLCGEAAMYVENGANILILSDRNLGPERVAMPSLLAVAAVHHHLVRRGTRLRTGLVIESGEPRSIHDMATLIGFGAAAINPYVMFESLDELVAQYRIYDLMLLISQVLHTYARGSAYVELDAWTGISCKDCGITMSPDDSYGCQRCGSELCDDCRHSCAACEESHCSGCLSCCPECEMEFCRGCMEVCPDCHRKVCCQCMEDGLCPSCREKQFQEEKDEHDADDDKSTDRAEGYPDGQAGTGEPSQEASRAEDVATGKTEPDAAVEPDCLGEALVPA